MNLEQEIRKGLRNAKKSRELYELLSSYNAYNIMLINAEKELKTNNREEYFDLDDYSNADCYGEQIDILFSLFKNDECIKGNDIEEINIDERDMIFLVNDNTLLRINTFYAANTDIYDLTNIDYELIKFNNCKGKVYTHSIYHSDPYYCDFSWEDKKAFGLFDGDKLITQNYEYKRRFREYNNADIRDILKIQTIDDIYDKMTDAKNNKIRKLIITKN